MDMLLPHEQNPEAHIRNVVAVLTDSTVANASVDLKVSAGVYLKNYTGTLLTNIITNTDNDESKRAGKNQLSFLISVFTLTVLSPNCQMRFKHNLTSQLTRFLITYQQLDQSPQSQDSYTMLSEFVRQIIQGLYQTDQFETIQGAIVLCENAFTVANTPEKFQKVFETIIASFTAVAETTVSTFKQQGNELLKSSNLIADAHDPISVKVMNSLMVLASWTRVQHQILDRFEAQSYFGYEHFVRSNALSNVNVALLGLNINQEQQSILSISGIQKVDQIINEIKSKTLESLRLILGYVFDCMNTVQQDLIPYVHKMKAVAPVLIQSAHFFATHTNLLAMEEDQALSDLLCQILEILVVLCSQNPYYDIFAQNKVHLIVSVCLNLMQTTSTEAQLIMNDPTEFVNLALDCCDKQKSGVIKTEACMLLEHICDHIDGATTCATTFCCNALNLALRDNTSGVVPPQIAPQGLWEMENDPFIQRTPPIIVAETCIVALTVISYILPKKQHLLPHFQEALAVNIDAILTRNVVSKNASLMEQCLAVVLRQRFSLLLGYYADMLFLNHQEAFVKTVNFLFESVSYPINSPEQVIALQSIDTLNTVVSDTDLAPRLEPLLPQISVILQNLTGVITYPHFFEFLQEFVKFYAPALTQNVLPLLERVIGRILQEQQKKVQDPSYNPQMIISKCWNVIRAIVDRTEYMPHLAVAIEQLMKPLLIFLADPQKISFDDDIIMCIKAVIKRMKTVTPIQWEILYQFPKILEKNKHSLCHLLDTINFYLLFGKADLQASSSNAISTIAQMAETALFTTQTNVTINNTEGAILIQLLFQTMRGTEALNSIFEPLLDRLRIKLSTPTSETVKKHVCCAFLSAMLYNNNAALNYLGKNKMTGSFVQQVLETSKNMRHKYELKLVLIALSEMLLCQLLPEDLRPLMPGLIQEMIDIKSKISKMEEKEKIRESAHNQNEEDSSDDDDDSIDDQLDSDSDGEVFKENANDVRRNWEDDEVDYNESKFDISVTLDVLDSPVKKVNETMAFQAALKSLSKRCPQDLQMLINALPEAKKKLVTEMFQSQKVQVGDDVATRRIVKVKRQTNQEQKTEMPN